MTDLIPLFQLVATFAALLLFGLMVLGLLRRPNATYLSLLLRSALIPAAAFTWYALFPVELNPETPISWIGVSLIVAGVVFGIYNRRLVVGMRGSVANSRLLTRQVQLGVVAVYCLTLGISCVVWIFEPAFAVANIALSLAWAVVWIPGRFRRASAVVSVDVDADSARAWDFIVDPAHRVEYQINVLAYTAEPPGPLRLGSKVTANVRVPLRRPVAAMKEVTVEFRYLVTDFVPGSTLTTSVLETPAITRTDLTPIGSGTRITISSRVSCSVLLGIAGGALGLKRSMRQTMASQQTSLAALKVLLATTT